MAEDEHKDRPEKVCDLTDQCHTQQVHPLEVEGDDDNEEAVVYNFNSEGERIPFYPFKPQDVYTCPFKSLGQCPKSTTFKDSRALAAHMKQKHPNQIISPFDQDPLEDGTMKIPCPKLCGKLFATYNSANQHAKNPTMCSRPMVNIYPQRCPWIVIPGFNCVEILDSQRGAATHAGVHVRDTRGIYQCHKCDDYWMDLYLLASHLTRCKGADRRRRSGAYHRLELGGSEPSCVVIVARSSQEPPKSWFMGNEFVEDGLPEFAAMKFEDFKTDYAFDDRIAATFHAASAVMTRRMPAPVHCDAAARTGQEEQAGLKRASRLTDGVVKDLLKMSEQNLKEKPILLSIGLDGFACHVPLIQAFLKRVPAFLWIIRETELVHGMKQEYFPRHKTGLYYGVFKSTCILAGIEDRLCEGDDA